MFAKSLHSDESSERKGLGEEQEEERAHDGHAVNLRCALVCKVSLSRIERRTHTAKSSNVQKKK